MYYIIVGCSGEKPMVTEVDLALYGLSVGDFFHAEGWPNSCFEVVGFSGDKPPYIPTPIYPVGPVFGSCIDCFKGSLAGCTDPTACNFNPCATVDDETCFYNNVTIKILCNKPLTNCNINSNCNKNGK